MATKPKKKESIGAKMIRKAKTAKNSKEMAKVLTEGIVDSLKEKRQKQTVMNLETGELEDVDADETGMVFDDEEDDMDSEDRASLRQSQAKIIATLTGIVMKPASRVWAMKIVSPKMVDELTRIYKEQKAFMLMFRVPTNIEKGIVKSWQEVEFETRLKDLSLKGGTATCHGDINHNGACLMSELIQNWKTDQIEFFLDGIQQTLF